MFAVSLYLLFCIPLHPCLKKNQDVFTQNSILDCVQAPCMWTMCVCLSVLAYVSDNDQDIFRWRTKIKCEIEMTKVMPEDVIKDREELHSRLQKKMVTLWCILLSSIITEHEEGIPLHIPPSERHFMLCASVQQNLRADLLSCEGLGSRLSTIYA